MGWGGIPWGGAAWGGSFNPSGITPPSPCLLTTSSYPTPTGVIFGEVELSRFSGVPSTGFLSLDAQDPGLIFFSPSLFTGIPNNQLDIDEISVTTRATEIYDQPVQENNRTFIIGSSSSSRTNNSLFRTQPKEYTALGIMVQTIPPGPTTYYYVI